MTCCPARKAATTHIIVVPVAKLTTKQKHFYTLSSLITSNRFNVESHQSSHYGNEHALLRFCALLRSQSTTDAFAGLTITRSGSWLRQYIVDSSHFTPSTITVRLQPTTSAIESAQSQSELRSEQQQALTRLSSFLGTSTNYVVVCTKP